MPHGPPVPLTLLSIDLDSPEFAAIMGWPFADPFVIRLLQSDIPQRMLFNHCAVWVYRDPDGNLVGFGTLDLCGDCSEFTSGQLHPYIPLLAINPTIKSLGYGTSIVRHLIDEAALLALRTHCHDVLFLDVYTTNAKAIGVYQQAGFVTISPQPISDPEEGGETYVIMARRVSLEQRNERQNG